MKKLFAIFLLFIALDIFGVDAWASSNVQVSADPCLPFTMPSPDVFFASPKKIFAHYLYSYPLSIDNRDPDIDYYNRHYLNQDGEAGKWRDAGGYLRARPLLVTSNSDENWQIQNMQREIRMAMARGITGWTFNIMNAKVIAPEGELQRMLKAAKAVDSRFKIVLMPDMSNAALGKDTDVVMEVIKAVYKDPSLYHLADGRLVVAPFNSENIRPETWREMINQLAAKDIDIAFMPTFRSLNRQYVYEYKPLSAGFGTFATAVPAQFDTAINDAAAAHKAVDIFMNGVGAQNYSPNNGSYWEAAGSLAYRNAWEGTMQSKSEMVQLTTWNDFSESTQIAPYTDASLAGNIGTGFYNLTGYFASWFIANEKPEITHDVLYYFYRKVATDAVAPKQYTKTKILSQNPAVNQIELLGFLKEPGTLVITIAGKTYTKQALAGITSFVIPLESGVPQFSLSRDGNSVISFSGIKTYGKTGMLSETLDLTYWGGSASEAGVCSISFD